MEMPRTHPRYLSLSTREKIAKGIENGLVTPAGLAAHGRGEAFDYLLGERTVPEAEREAKIAAAAMLSSSSPVISTNGNSTVLAADEIVELARATGARIEVNLFHPSEERNAKLAEYLEERGAREVLGRKGDARIPGLGHNRALCSEEGIFSADTVLVLLEDGDRTKALKKMGKRVIAVDLNPMSRTARTCDIPVIDNVIRAVPEITKFAKELRGVPIAALKEMVEQFEPEVSLGVIAQHIVEFLKGEFASR